MHADPADDALAKLNELSRQAEQTTEEMHTAQLDLEKKLAAQKIAEQKRERVSTYRNLLWIWHRLDSRVCGNERRFLTGSATSPI